MGVTKIHDWTTFISLSNEQKLDVKLLQFPNKIYLRMQKPLPLEDKYAKSLQLCPTMCDPIDSSPSGSPIPGILQARVLEWVAFPYSTHLCPFCFQTDIHTQDCSTCKVLSLLPDHIFTCRASYTQLYTYYYVSESEISLHGKKPY